AVDATARTAACLDVAGDALVLRTPDGAELARHAGPVLVVGGGKAALGMARAVAERAGARCAGGVVVVPHGGVGPCPGGVDVRGAGHPVPDGAGVAATRRLLTAVERARGDTLVVCVLSGGASALLVAPTLGLALADKRLLTERLLRAGADVTALNTIR